MPHVTSELSSRPAGPYDMNERLAVEAESKDLVPLLFMPHAVKDISESVEQRKSGTDFLLKPLNSDGSYGGVIRCENKFDQYLTGRTLLEIISVDRPRLVPGWMYTSQAAWLLSWYRSGECIAVPLDAARKLILGNPSKYFTTTTPNKGYLTWSALIDMNELVRVVDNARVLDLSHELGVSFEGKRMLNAQALEKRCTSEELVSLMRTLPGSSVPVPVEDEALKDVMRAMHRKDFRKAANRAMLMRLGWLA